MGDSGDEFRQQQQRRERRRRRGPGAGAAGPAALRPPEGGGGGGPEALGPALAPVSAPERGGVRCQLCREDLSALDPLRRELHANRCLDRMETERPPGPASQEQRQQQQQDPRRRRRPRGLKRSGGGSGGGASSSAEPLAKKPKPGLKEKEDLLLALALSRSLREEEEARSRGREGPRAGKKRRPKAPRSPPPLLLQDPGKARRETEARAAALLLVPLPAEAGLPPRTPPLPASRLLEAQAALGGSLWASSSLTGGSLPGSLSPSGLSLPSTEQGFGASPLFLRPGPAAGLPGMGRLPLEPGSSQAHRPSTQRKEALGSQDGAEGALLRDLEELAGEGLTLTQWDRDVRWLEGPRQEWAALRSAPQKSPEERESSGSSVKAVLKEASSPHQLQLSSLATAFGTMVNNPHLSDVQFQVDSGEILYAHMFVLYVRCPQLLEVIDRTAFVVAEEGGTETLRMLLGNVPAEAVSAFLKYLYAADLCVPRHLQSDVGALAARFGLRELAALCGSHLSFRVSGGTEDGVQGCEVREDRAETFEELLESMWQNEDEEAFIKCAHQEENSSETVGEEELEEIYEFAATQRGSAARTRREEEEEEGKKGCSKGKGSQEGRWGGPHFTSSKEGPGDPATAPGTTTGTEPPALPCSPVAGWEERPQQLSLALQQGAEDRRRGRRQQSLRAPEEASAQGCLAEGQRCSLETSGVGSRGKPLRPVQKVFPGDSPCEPLVPTLLPRDLVLAPSPRCGVGLTRSYLPGSSSSSSSQTALEVPCGGPGEPLLEVNPLPGSPDGGPVVVLDSDEEWESGASVGGPLRRLDSSSGKSQELLRLSSSDEEDSGEGGKMLAPDTPLPDRPTPGSLPNTGASLMPEPKGQKWIGEIRRGYSPERSSLRDQLPLACGPLSLVLPTPLPGGSLRNEVVVVDDSQEEQESPVEEGRPIWQNRGDADSQAGGPSRPMGSEGAAATAEREERGWTGGAGDDSDDSEILPLTQRSPPSPVVPTQTTPDPASKVKERLLPVTPLTPMPSYSVMATPELKKELKRFGVRALPKRQMVLKLKEIFQFTHQRRDDESKERAPASPLAPLPCSAGTLWESQQVVRSRDQREESAQEAELRGFPGGSEQLKRGTALPAARFTLGRSAGSGGCLSSPPASQESTTSSVASSETSVLSHSSPLSEFETSELAAEEEEEEALVPTNCDEGKLEAFRRYIHSTPALCRQILLYQPIELAVLQATLKQNGIRIGLSKLLDFLDAHCITFTTAEARREKLQHSQQGRKRRGQRHRR